MLIVMWLGIWLVFIGASQADDANAKWAARLEDAAPKFDDEVSNT